MILEAIGKAGYKVGEQVLLALDPAVSELYEDGYYTLKIEGKRLSSDEMVKMWESWTGQYPIISLEDPFAEDDFAAWVALAKTLGKKIQIVAQPVLHFYRR